VLSGIFLFGDEIRLRAGERLVGQKPRPVALAPTATHGASAAAGDLITLGVMAFRSRGSEEADDWRSEALRDGLNTQLSQLSRVKVYSKEFIDFLVTRRGLTEIEVANELGITKMLSGSFTAVGDVLRIETHVIDVGTGVLEASHTAQGAAERFPELQSDMVFGVIAKLDLPITAEEKTRLAAQTGGAEALRLILQAEGEAAVGPPRAPSPTPGAEAGYSGWLRVFVSAAHAQEPADDTAAIEAVLDLYRKALEAGDAAAVGSLYTSFSDDQREAQERYFENVRELEIRIEDVDVAVVGDEAVASYTRTDTFVDRRTGQPMNVTIRLTKMMQKNEEGWKFLAH
jgi:ketosteroid isomerase-like protein/TolB-like protein